MRRQGLTLSNIKALYHQSCFLLHCASAQKLPPRALSGKSHENRSDKICSHTEHQQHCFIIKKQSTRKQQRKMVCDKASPGIYFLSQMKSSIIINFSLNHGGCSPGILQELKFPHPCFRHFPELVVIKYSDWGDFYYLGLLIPPALFSK